MKTIICVAFLMASCWLYADEASQHPTENQYAQNQSQLFKSRVKAQGLLAVATSSDAALDAIVGLSMQKLKEANDTDFASVMEIEWAEKYHGFIANAMLNRHDIGDHAPLILWLATLYDHLEAVLGVDVCKSLHLSDIKTFNYAIPVVFHPCTFPMDAVTGTRIAEYERHFDEGAVYYGLAPVVVYWLVNIGCNIISGGGGSLTMVCGLASDLAEKFTAAVTAPVLSDIVYVLECGPGATLGNPDPGYTYPWPPK